MQNIDDSLEQSCLVPITYPVPCRGYRLPPELLVEQSLHIVERGTLLGHEHLPVLWIQVGIYNYQSVSPRVHQGRTSRPLSLACTVEDNPQAPHESRDKPPLA